MGRVVKPITLVAAVVALLTVSAGPALALTSGTNNGFTLTNTAKPNPGTVGKPITFTITLANHNKSKADNVVLSDALPPGMTLGPVKCSASTQGTLIVTGGPDDPVQVYCEGFALARGAKAKMRVVATPTKTGSFTNIASDSETPDVTNNVVNEQFTVNDAPPAGHHHHHH